MRVHELHDLLVDAAGTEPASAAGALDSVVTRARRARRARRAQAGIAAMALIAVTTAVALNGRSHDAPRSVVVTPGPEHVEVVALATEPVPGRAGAYTSRLIYVDPETGRSVSRAIPENNYGEYPVQMLRIGKELLMPGGEGVVAAPLDLSAPPRDLAPGLVFVPSADPNRFWSVTGFGFGNRGPYEVTEFDARGDATSAELALPPDAGWPIAGTDAGLLVRGPADEVMLWDPVRRKVVWRIAGVPAFSGNGWTNGMDFAWVGYGCSPLPTCPTFHVRDLRTGSRRAALGAPPGFTGFAPDGAVSPDGKTMAVFVDRSATDPGRRELALVDLEDGRITIVPDSARRPSHVTWSPDGRTLFFGTDDATGIAMWRVGDAEPRQLPVTTPPFTALIAVPVAS